MKFSFFIPFAGLGMMTLFVLNACKKDASINSVPNIKFLDVNATTITQFKDSLVIRFEYSDENGDIGENDPDKNSLLIKDRRLAEPDFYFVKPLAPPESGIKINGTLTVHIKNTFLLGTGNSEITQFELKLRDRSGNWSNSINTPDITIVK